MEKINKVAEVGLLFWLMKIVATTLGETLGDYIAQTLHLGYTVGLIVTTIFFMLVLAVQLHAKKHIPVFYWLVIIATTTLGTEISDFIDRSLHLGYTIGSLLLFSGLVLTLLLWFKKFKSLEVYPITNQNKEIYYWIAILFSNSLGTAFGDYLSDVIGLSYLNGALVTAAIILIVVLLHYTTKINHIVLFWIAFIFSRPFGATFGDFLTKPITKGGLDLGTLSASVVSLIVMSLLIIRSHSNMYKKQL
ncbi:membrane protein [Flavobacterium frigoris]|uniref:INTEGRAL MEMBRANE PROTEIN (Rhomboid family) n=1 Tax=Flavobacterium frigoris (strain PS1) TaxID=1086011 RepID=H7FLI7_FLAFP|nr:membrane protein [Flavobacterium frigoris]EIA10529.1 INTEGRAL MEMBRANE PROTEIN (Rhomboid family) [Flavobacterium frigoris PS1]